MPIETRSNNALFRRAEQLKRWEDSETNKVSTETPPSKKSKIKFSDGCVFLAACASGDTEEVERLLQQGADINTANVDGLTALHQACIDDNLDMVEFLVEHGCDVNQGDNEGWTPLHATASCGFVSIAVHLIEHQANVAAVNNDGDLPIDIAESPRMEELLSDILDEKGIDCDDARNEEERIMLEDASQWLKDQKFQDHIHSRTGASALHVAAAKGYVKVMDALIQAGADLNAQDNDGWTPLHAASHWAQKEVCAMLTDNLANMDIQNFAGQTCFDVSEPDLVKLLEELKKKQASMQKERPEIQSILQRTSTRPPLKRRTSVTRMSGHEKSKSVMKDTKSERAQIEQLSLPEEEVDEDKEKKQIENREIATRQEVKSMDESIATTKKMEVEETITKPPVDRIPSWKKMLRRSSENLAEDTKSAAEPEVVMKKPKNIDSEEEKTSMESSNGPMADNNNRERSFIPPVRDEESELQRKAHAKRVRETRRSTQGVLLEDVKTAELQYIIKTTQKARESQPDDDDDDDEKEDDQKENDEESKSSHVPVSGDNTNEACAKKQKPANLDISLKQSSEANRSSEPSSPDISPSVTLVLKNKTAPLSDEQSSPDSRTSLATAAAIQRRRRPKRRSTGVVYLDSDDAVEEKENNVEKEKNRNSNKDKEQEQRDDKAISDRVRNRYGSTTYSDVLSDASSRSETPSRYSSLSCSKSSLNEDTDKDYKKLYEELKKETERLKELEKENEQLRETLQKTEEEFDRTKKLLKKVNETNNSRNSVSEAEKKERRALERKLSEMEEEVKQIEKLRADNERLKDENGALIRVISKLSK